MKKRFSLPLIYMIIASLCLPPGGTFVSAAPTAAPQASTIEPPEEEGVDFSEWTQEEFSDFISSLPPEDIQVLEASLPEDQREIFGRLRSGVAEEPPSEEAPPEEAPALNANLQAAIEKLQSDNIRERAQASQTILSALQDPAQAGQLTDQDKAFLQASLAPIFGANYLDMLSPEMTARWQARPLSSEQRLTLQSGEALTDIPPELTQEELRRLEQYILQKGQHISDVVNSKYLVHGVEMVAGDTETPQAWEDYRNKRKAEIKRQLEKASQEGGLPTYAELSDEQKEKLASTLYRRSAQVAWNIRQHVNMEGMFDEQGNLIPGQKEKLEAAIRNAAQTATFTADAIPAGDAYAPQTEPHKQYTLSEFIALKPTHLDPTQVQEFNQAQEEIRRLKEETAQAILLSSTPPPADKSFLKDSGYAQYHLGGALQGFLSNIKSSIEESAKNPEKKAQAERELGQYKTQLQKIFTSIVEQSPYEKKSPYAQVLGNDFGQARTLADLQKAVLSAQTKLEGIHSPHQTAFEEKYRDQLIPFNNLMAIVSDQGSFISSDQSKEAFRRLTENYFKGQTDSPTYHQIVDTALNNKHPSVKNEAVQEIKA
ncbi:MAG: hypothetical protein HYY62_07715, partial [Deltaproteobacteria bacterium]|nr:hypothetical protein [Deltaproteobacteria bacterium]